MTPSALAVISATSLKHAIPSGKPFVVPAASIQYGPEVRLLLAFLLSLHKPAEAAPAAMDLKPALPDGVRDVRDNSADGSAAIGTAPMRNGLPRAWFACYPANAGNSAKASFSTTSWKALSSCK